MDPFSPQPNLVAEENTHRLPPIFWVLLVLTGIGTGLGGAALMWLLHAVQHLFWSYKTGDFLSAVERTSNLHRFVVLLIGGAVAAASLLVRHYAIGGHGGEVAEGIWFKRGHFPFLRTTFSAVLSIIIVALGASVGREGAPKQVGAAIASQLSGWFHLTTPQRRLLAACGAGAGMAAVYNVPLGGALFAMEVLLGTLAFPMVIPALIASFIATAVSWIYLPIGPTYSLPSFHVSISEIVWALIFGPIAGLASVVYVRAIVWADRGKPQGWLRIASPIVVFALLGVLAMKFPQLLGNGKDTAQLAFLNSLDIKLLAILMVLKLGATAGCLRTGVPGGLFTPTVTVGALLGGLCGHLWAHAGLGAASGSYAILGAGAVLAAATQGPVSAIALLLELTWRLNGIMVPLMVAVAGATITAKWLEPRSIYSARVRLGKSAAQNSPPVVPTGFDQLMVKEINVVSAADHYSVILKTLLASPRSRAYVVDEKGEYLGEIDSRDATDPGIQGPLDTTTASDLVRYVEPLTTNLTRAEVFQTLASANHQLPVVDGDCRLVGAAEHVASGTKS